MIDTGLLITVREISERTHYERSAVQRWSQQDSFPDPLAILGRISLFPTQEVSAWLDKHKGCLLLVEPTGHEVDLEDLLLTSEVAELQGVSYGAIYKRAWQSMTFPDPVWTLGKIRFWSKKEVLAWQPERITQRAPEPKW